MLKIKADKPLPYVTFGDSSAAQVGDWVMAVGNPFGLGGTVTTGIISARGRDIHSGPFDDFLQIDAPINRGNSGGPTFNLDGQVIGINTAIYSPNGGSVGIGFAVPSNVAKTVVAQLEEHGKVSRGWLGVQIQEVTPAIAASLGLQGEHGALVAVVTPDSPGAKAGLKQGDVILSFNGNEVSRLRDLPRLVAETAPDTGAKMKVWRNGQTVELQATLGELPNTEQVASATGGQEEDQSATRGRAGDAFRPAEQPAPAGAAHWKRRAGRGDHPGRPRQRRRRCRAERRRRRGCDRPAAGQNPAGGSSEIEGSRRLAKEERSPAAQSSRRDAICRRKPRRKSGLNRQRARPRNPPLNGCAPEEGRDVITSTNAVDGSARTPTRSGVPSRVPRR